MRLRALKLFLLSIAFALAAALPPALAQSPSDAELKALNGRVIALYQAGKYGEAIPLAQQYVAGTKARYGENAPEYATALNNLAQLLQATNRLAEAEPLMRRAIAIDETSLGPDHPNVANDLNNLAQLLQATNRLAEAEPLMRRALANRRGELRPRSSQRGQRPQQPGAAAAGHEPACRGRALDAPCARDRRGKPWARSSRTWPETSTIWRRCCRTRTGLPRPSP